MKKKSSVKTRRLKQLKDLGLKAMPAIRDILDRETNLDTDQIQDVIDGLSLYVPDIVARALDIPPDVLGRIDILNSTNVLDRFTDQVIWQVCGGLTGSPDGKRSCDPYGCDGDSCADHKCGTNDCHDQICQQTGCKVNNKTYGFLDLKDYWKDYAEFLSNAIKKENYTQSVAAYFNPDFVR